MKINKKYYSIFILLLVVVTANAASSNEASIMDWVYQNFILVLGLIVILAALLTFFRFIMNMLTYERHKMQVEAGEREPGYIEKPSIFERIESWAWSIVPVREESKIDLGHDYDGIRELDNRLPPWWLALFYGTIIFAFGYMYNYHWSGSGWSSTKQWEEEVRIGDKQKKAYLTRMANKVNEETVTYLDDPASLDMGKLIFNNNCIACHGTLGEGNNIGPNLTDEYWIHGGGVKNVFKTIKYGVKEKGMIAWKEQIKPSEMQKLASYVVSLQGTNPPNAKAKQGVLYKPE